MTIQEGRDIPGIEKSHLTGENFFKKVLHSQGCIMNQYDWSNINIRIQKSEVMLQECAGIIMRDLCAFIGNDE